MNKLIHYILPALLIVLLSLSVANKSNAQDQAIMVIANDKGAPATMTMKELKSVMLGEKQRWADGTGVLRYVVLDICGATIKDRRFRFALKHQCEPELVELVARHAHDFFGG